jgi:hypothetical protein
VQRATCSVQRAACSMQHATCNVQRAACSVQGVAIILQPSVRRPSQGVGTRLEHCVLLVPQPVGLHLCRCTHTLHQDWARPSHICTGTGPTPAHICTGTGLALPQLHPDCTCPCHICAGTLQYVVAERTHDVPRVGCCGGPTLHCAAPRLEERRVSSRSVGAGYAVPVQMWHG